MKEIYEDSDENTNINVRKNLFELPDQYLWDYIMNRLFRFHGTRKVQKMEMFPQYSKLWHNLIAICTWCFYKNILKHEMITDVPICFVEHKIDTLDECQNIFCLSNWLAFTTKY
jgi:hypothetical protein